MAFSAKQLDTPLARGIERTALQRRRKTNIARAHYLEAGSKNLRVLSRVSAQVSLSMREYFQTCQSRGLRGEVGWWARKIATTQTTPTRTQDAGLTSQCPPTTSLPRRPMGVSGSRRPGSEPGHHRAEGKSVLCLSPIIYAAFVCAFTFYRDEYSRHRARCRVR